MSNFTVRHICLSLSLQRSNVGLSRDSGVYTQAIVLANKFSKIKINRKLQIIINIFQRWETVGVELLEVFFPHDTLESRPRLTELTEPLFLRKR